MSALPRKKVGKPANYMNNYYRNNNNTNRNQPSNNNRGGGYNRNDNRGYSGKGVNQKGQQQDNKGDKEGKSVFLLSHYPDCTAPDA